MQKTSSGPFWPELLQFHRILSTVKNVISAVKCFLVTLWLRSWKDTVLSKAMIVTGLFSSTCLLIFGRFLNEIWSLAGEKKQTTHYFSVTWMNRFDLLRKSQSNSSNPCLVKTWCTTYSWIYKPFSIYKWKHLWVWYLSNIVNRNWPAPNSLSAEASRVNKGRRKGGSLPTCERTDSEMLNIQHFKSNNVIFACSS